MKREWTRWNPWAHPKGFRPAVGSRVAEYMYTLAEEHLYELTQRGITTRQRRKWPMRFYCLEHNMVMYRHAADKIEGKFRNLVIIVEEQ